MKNLITKQTLKHLGRIALEILSYFLIGGMIAMYWKTTIEHQVYLKAVDEVKKADKIVKGDLYLKCGQGVVKNMKIIVIPYAVGMKFLGNPSEVTGNTIEVIQ